MKVSSSHIIELDGEFHRKFVALSRNERLQTIFDGVSMQIQLARARHSFNISLVRISQQEHNEIQSALIERNTGQLIQMMDAHIEASIARMAIALEKHSAHQEQVET